MSNKRGPILVTRVLGNEILNIGEKILPARPKTAKEKKNLEKRKVIANLFRYIKTQ